MEERKRLAFARGMRLQHSIVEKRGKDWCLEGQS